MQPKIKWSRFKDPLVNITKKQVPIALHGMGFYVPRTVDLLSSRCEFWCASTNFWLTPAVVDKVRVVPGVETLRLLTNYRFVVSFGELFQSQAVKQAINAALGIKKRQKPVDRMELFRRDIAAKHPYWAVIKHPSGKIEAFGDQQSQPVLTTINEYKTKFGTLDIRTWLDE